MKGIKPKDAASVQVRFAIRAGLLAFICILSLGCRSTRGIDATAADRHVVIFPGISGRDVGTSRICKMMSRECRNTSAQVFDWTSTIQKRLWLGNLQDVELNKRRAKVIAESLEKWRATHPGTKLFLVGHSGGVGLILFTCEALPDDFEIEGMVLMSGAVSPQFDLSKAMRISRRGIVAYSSSKDTALLNLGTSTFGMIDRTFGKAAGNMGFDSKSETSHDGKLHQIRWEPSDRSLGNSGGHLGPFATRFFRAKIMPYLCGDSP